MFAKMHASRFRAAERAVVVQFPFGRSEEVLDA
jgi:hypothetical protein